MSTTSAWACGTSELTPCNCLRMLSADRFCESRMREILTSGSMRGEDVVPWASPPLLLYRTQDLWQCTPFNCSSASLWNIHYTYDLAGDLTTWTHPAGFTITHL